MPTDADAPGPVPLGAVRCPSGRMMICDWVSSLDWRSLPPPDAAGESDAPRVSIQHDSLNLAMAAVVDGLQPCAAYPVTAVHVPDGLFKGSIRHLFVTVRHGLAAERRKIGTVPVDYGRVVAMDAATDLHWDDDICIDGLADVTFCGPHGAEVAAEVGAAVLRAPRGSSCFGWRDLPVDEGARRARDLQALASRDKQFAVALCPHTEQWGFSERLRQSPQGAIEIEWAGSRLIFFDADFGHHLFHIYADHDETGLLLRVVVDLECDPFD